jgi:hypothetical protein
MQTVRRWGIRELRVFWLVVALLILIVLSRSIRISGFILDNDEIWSIWQTFGTPQQILVWTSPTENPIYFLLLGYWKDLVGFDPVVLRWLSLLLTLPGAAMSYRLGRRLQGEAVGILLLLAYSGIAISQFLALYVRSYSFAVVGLPLALWLALHYFDLAQQGGTVRQYVVRALPLALTLYGMYAGTVTAVPALALLMIFLFVRYGLHLWRGILPAGLALLLVLPDLIFNKLQQVSNHTGSGRPVNLPPLPTAVAEFVTFFFSAPGIWLLLLLSAALAIGWAFYQRRLRGMQRWQYGYWMLWVVGVPILLYMLEARLGFYFIKRYAWWYVFGVAVLLALGLGMMPRLIRWAGGSVLVLLLFIPFDLNGFGYLTTPVGVNLRWLRDHWQTGDVLVMGPGITCNYPEEWDYYTRLYFPNGLDFAPSVPGEARVWYVTSIDAAALEVTRTLAEGRMPGRFVGPPGCLIRLYEAPPDVEGVLFDNGMRFHGFQIMRGDRPLAGPYVFHEGEAVRVRLWWSVDQAVERDYSLSLRTTRERLYTQVDGAPQPFFPADAPLETSRWQPRQVYVMERELPMPDSIFRGDMLIQMVLYLPTEGSAALAPGSSREGVVTLQRIQIVSW